MNCCVLIMYNGVPVGAILIMRSLLTEGLSASMTKYLLRHPKDGDGQGYLLFSRQHLEGLQTRDIQIIIQMGIFRG